MVGSDIESFVVSLVSRGDPVVPVSSVDVEKILLDSVVIVISVVGFADIDSVLFNSSVIEKVLDGTVVAEKCVLVSFVVSWVLVCSLVVISLLGCSVDVETVVSGSVFVDKMVVGTDVVREMVVLSGVLDCSLGVCSVDAIEVLGPIVGFVVVSVVV